MISGNIRKWVMEARKRGVKVSQIKKELKEHNYDESLADEILKYEKKPDKKIIMATSILTIIILSILGYVLFEKFYMTEDKLLKKAENLYFKKDYDKAKTIYDKILEKNSSNYYVVLRLGNIYYQEGDYEKAISLFKSIPPKAKFKNAPHILFKIGLAYFRSADYANAKTYFSKELSQNPEDYLAGSFLGATYLKLEDYEKSKTYFEKVLEVMPNSTVSYRGLGLAYYNLKDYQNAKKYLSMSIEYYPEDYSVNFALGSTHYYLDEYENSYKYTTKALSIKPDSEEAKEVLKLVSEKQSKSST